MSSKYKRKSDRQLFTQAQLTTAQDKIAAGSSVRAAAKFVGVHEATLRKRLKSVSSIYLFIWSSYGILTIVGLGLLSLK